LRARGCTAVGLISPELESSPDDGKGENFHELFAVTARSLGLRTDAAWVRKRDDEKQGLEAFGYEAFSALWDTDTRPDGLLVYPDTAARGVMTAALEHGIGVPGELKLVFHRNTGVDWVCPLAVDWAVSDVTRWAAEMIREVRRQKAGGAPDSVLLDYELAGSV
jgi:DNA-binding LacI/PurR family transcriptional regulator